jgi:exodeoxyribonuclease V alpha subunit
MTTTAPPGVQAIPAELAAYEEAGAIGAGDVAATALLVALARREAPCAPSLLAWVAMALALRSPRDGHTCVDLERIVDWCGDIDPSAAVPPWPADADAWIAALDTAPALVGRPGERKPFIVDGRRLYLARSLAEEQAIASALLRDGARHVSVLLGGPGSGKTWTLANDLIAEFAQAVPTLGGADAPAAPRVALAAPTGKAAARMAEALKKRCAELKAPETILQAIDAARPTTVHRLLGYAPDRTPRFAHGPGNPLDYDIVVVDEVSMLSSSLMHQLLAAVSVQTRIRFVGDPDQLASVESGSVLADIAAAASRPGCALRSRTTRLTGQHRYAPESAIARLAIAIQAGDVRQALDLLRAGDGTVVWITPGDGRRLDELTGTVVDHARALGAMAGAPRGRSDDDAAAAALLAEMGRLQVLCALRSGSSGVAGWNERIERRLGASSGPAWYAGRPIMVTRNNPDIELSNGDVGIAVPDRDGRMEAVFTPGDRIVRVPAARLEDVATVHALTIHKSQGSEYGHAIVVLPEKRSLLLTRELFYTGVTRAAKQVTVVGSRDVIAAAIERPIRRASGLADRLSIEPSRPESSSHS